MKIRIAIATMMFFYQVIISGQAMAIPFGGIDFPQGASSFADSVIQFNPLFNGGPAPTELTAIDPLDALGVPNFPAGGSLGDPGAVSLGNGGLLELLFADNLLTNSGDSGFDLHIFEVGPDVEDTFVAIRPTTVTLALLNPIADVNGDGFFEVGTVFGATSSIDIDTFFPGFIDGALAFDAVQLIDDPNEGNNSGVTVGADIDAVGAISSSPAQVPEPYTLSLLILGLAGIQFIKRRRPTCRI